MMSAELDRILGMIDDLTAAVLEWADRDRRSERKQRMSNNEDREADRRAEVAASAARVSQGDPKALRWLKNPTSDLDEVEAVLAEAPHTLTDEWLDEFLGNVRSGR